MSSIPPRHGTFWSSSMLPCQASTHQHFTSRSLSRYRQKTSCVAVHQQSVRFRAILTHITPTTVREAVIYREITTMTDAQSKDNAAKSRIISHLNADHQATLSLYLRHYNGLSAYAARDVTMTDISFNEMTFRTKDGKTRAVPFNPPMQAWSEARMRTVEMDKQARAGLGLSSIKITEYEYPHGVFQWTVIASILFATVVYIYRKEIVPGTFVYDVLLPWFPGGHKTFFTTVKRLPYGVLGIHLLEAIWLDLGWLQKHDVRRGSALWWKWFLSAVGEGGGSIARVNAQVKRKEAEAAKRQH